ncbi:MAG: DUF4276 family protein [Hormoscilla sp. GM7CHS1pb]|nr:DUF4276 family protein [Hormoscilla sp. GM7CHS1pb]
MKEELRYTLLSDGSSDKALQYVLTWLLREHIVVNCAIQSEWADLGRLPKPPKKLPDRIKKSLELYPCDLLFVHRDAEKEPRQKRVDEIRKAIESDEKSLSVPAVCVIPVRMQEAWLLFDEKAIRRASGNPGGRQALKLPDLAKVEELSDPKNILYTVLRQASELGPKRLKKFNVNEKVHRVAELIDDFTPLLALSAFRALEVDIEQAIEKFGWSK